MKYFKHEGVVVANEYQPMIINEDAYIFVEGNKVKMEHLSPALASGLTVSFASGFLTPWEEVSELEYKMYMATQFDFLATASQQDQTGIWALNGATEPQLRLGGEDPDGNSLDHVVSRDGKLELVAKTQHWYHPNRPRQRDTNSQWTRWIMRIRKTEPFIYLG